ncbi:MAG: phosphoribosyltransferase [Acidobacteria bacterium]|nr:phosphoribosyltransferase [Acidobacteriota bacterium]
MHFTNRAEAGRLLGQRLSHLRGQHPLVLGIPRGGVPVAAPVAAALAGELDVLLVRKLRTPGALEVAMGAIDEAGHVLRMHPDEVRDAASESAWTAEVAAQGAAIRARRRVISGVRPSAPLRGRLVVLVDDGMATGATMRAAVDAAKRQGAARAIVALPVAAADALAMLDGMADEVVCLHVPAWFTGVGAFYEDFGEASDAEVVALLRPTTPAS